MLPTKFKTPNNTNFRIHSTRESKFKFFRLDRVDLISFPLQKQWIYTYLRFVFWVYSTTTCIECREKQVDCNNTLHFFFGWVHQIIFWEVSYLIFEDSIVLRFERVKNFQASEKWALIFSLSWGKFMGKRSSNRWQQ